MTERNRDKNLLFALGCALSVILAAVGILALIFNAGRDVKHCACESLQARTRSVCAWCRKYSTGARGVCLALPFVVLVLIVLASAKCTMHGDKAGRFIPRREEPGCPCCRAALVHWCIHELGEWRHVFQYECMPVLERLADKLRAAAPPPPQP